MQQTRGAETIVFLCFFNGNPILFYECQEHFIDFIICKKNNSMLFSISKAFLALATRRRCGAGLPGGSGGRAARDSTYGQPLARSQRSFDFNVFVLLFENSYSKHMKINAFACFSMPQEAPRMGARLGAASGPVICVFSMFWVRFAFAQKTYENAYIFQACARPAAFRARFLRIFSLGTMVLYDFFDF